MHNDIVNQLRLKKLLFNIEKFKYPTFSAKIRNCSSYYNVIPQPLKSIGTHELKEYNMYFEVIVKFLVTSDKGIHKELSQHLKRILMYNVPCNKQRMGPLVVLTYKYFSPQVKQTSERINLAYAMGWVNDIAASSFQIFDDMEDLSKTRYNKPCWYLNDGVGLKAVNDAAILLENTFKIIKKYLGQHPSYVSILELTQDVKFKCNVAQTLNTVCNWQNKSDLEYFTPKMYNILAKLKGIFPFLIHPISTGMYLAEVFDQKLHSEVTSIFELLGKYFIAQNDILDCYGNPEVTGKYGTDIITGQCTWLAVRALMDSNASQRKEFEKNYGKSDLNSQEAIYKLYKDLDILNKFLLHEKVVYQELRNMVEKSSDSVPKKLMYKIIDPFFGKI